jgi:tRNA 2-selenouridine synthase
MRLAQNFEQPLFFMEFYLYCNMVQGRKYLTNFVPDGYIYVDIRNQEDFARGHIPGSLSFSFMTTLSFRKSVSAVKQTAERLGIATDAALWAEESGKRIPGNKPVVIVCRDGRIRSEFIRDALLPLREIYILKGGYRSFRREVRHSFSKQFQFIVLAGKTGCGKTEILKRLASQGYQVLDLEALAGSSGSVFGIIGGLPVQPYQEQFENEIYKVLQGINEMDFIFLEHENSSIGRCRIPGDLYRQFLLAPKIFLRLPKEERARCLVESYAGKDDRALKNGLSILSSRIGRTEAEYLSGLIDKGDYLPVAHKLLDYYDHSAGYEEVIGQYDMVVEENTVDSLCHELFSILQKKNAPFRKALLPNSAI